MLSIIAAIDDKGAIGYNNALLCHLPADLKYFKDMTIGKPIIMGRKTFESIGRPLPGRQNIVISRNLSPINGVDVVDSIESALEMVKQSPEAVIIGGSEIYQQFMDLADRLYITIIHHEFLADTHFPVIDPGVWNCREKVFRQKDVNNRYDMTFCIYDRR